LQLQITALVGNTWDFYSAEIMDTGAYTIFFFAIIILIYPRAKAACPTIEGVTFGRIWFLFVS
jgi:hypothetical protein